MKLVDKIKIIKKSKRKLVCLTAYSKPIAKILHKYCDILLVGDSMTHGACVNRPYDIASNLRLLKKNENGVLNLAYLGNGPLIEYAVLREYLKNKNVKNILWMYFEGNDLLNLQGELSFPILLKYLENKSFHQNLITTE